jgi:hypothetical protein
MDELCAYLFSSFLLHPSDGEVLSANARRALCTATRCYDSAEEAGFGREQETTSSSWWWMEGWGAALCFSTALLLASAAMGRERLVREK